MKAKQFKIGSSKIVMRQLTNGLTTITINGLPLTNANGAIDPASAGYNYLTEVLSEIRSQVIKQKFYRVAPADFFTVNVGEGAWKSELIQNRSYDIAGDFETGDIDTMPGGGRLANVDTFLDDVRMPTVVWAKSIRWNIAELAQAGAGNWDILSDKMETLKRNWDLGIQKVAFLGKRNNTSVTGFLNNSQVTINTTLITKQISSMSESEFTSFLSGLLLAFWNNAGATAMPNKFIIPADDYLGLGVPYSSTYPNVSKLQYMLDMLKRMTANDQFEIKPLAYCQDDYNAVAGINKNRYVLYNDDPEVMKMNIPVDFNMLDAQTANNVFWEQPSIGQYSGLLITREPEVIYFDETTSGS